MGTQFKAVCQICGHRFVVHQGPGLTFWILHCERCGRESVLPHGQMADTHLAFLPRPPAEASSDLAAEDAWREQIEAMAGSCPCGGRFRLDAAPRCPACGSDAVHPEGPHAERPFA